MTLACLNYPFAVFSLLGKWVLPYLGYVFCFRQK